MTASEGDVSVIIPTLRRPALLRRALDSVFAQTHAPREVIVVVDGPDPDTMAALASIPHSHLKVIQNEASLTAARARNTGAAAAAGSWIAFLDDDDEWHPRKLELQLEAGLAAGAEFVTCRSWVVTPEATYCWPTVAYDPKEPMDAYLFDRRSMISGSSFLQTSSFLIRRDAFAGAPFRSSGPHDDWDFVLRQVNGRGTRLVTVPEPLVNHYINYDGRSLSGATSWRASLAWAREMRSVMTRHAFSGFCLCVVGPRAASEAAWAALPQLLFHAFVDGKPRIRHVLTYLAFWTLPPRLRRRLRAWQRKAASSRSLGVTTPSGTLIAAADTAEY